MDSMKPLHKIELCVLFCVLGFLGNWYKVTLFLNVDFLFGSVFPMLAIMTIGSTCGVIAAFAAGTCTYFLWNHIWAIVIFTAEAVFVSRMYARGKGNVVIYDLLFWVCLGIPMVCFFYYHVMGFALQGTLVVMLKQSVNGVLNALLAALGIVLFKYVKKPAGLRSSYSELLFLVMASFALLPTVLLSVSAIRTYMDNSMVMLESRVSRVSETVRKHLSGWIFEHLENVKILSTLVGDPNTSSYAQMQHYVEIIKAATPAFKGMGVFNQNAVTVSYAPLRQDGKPNLGVNFSDRPHIAIMERGKKPYISDVLVSKLGNPSPIALLLAPIVVAGEYKGYCSGVIEISQIAGMLSNLKASDIHITVIDDHDQVIATTLPDFKTMDHFERPYFHKEATEEDSPLLWRPDLKPNSSVMQRWRSSFLFHSVPISNDCRWRVVVEASLLPLTEDVSRFGLERLAIQGVLIFASLLLSFALSNGFISAIKRLQVLTRSLPGELVDAARIAWPSSTIEEIAELSNNFRQMTAALTDYIADQKRTQEALRESRAKLEAALAGMADAVYITDNQGRLIDFNDAFVSFHRFKSREECSRVLSGGARFLDVSGENGFPLTPDKWAVPRALRGETETNVEYVLSRKDTAETWDGSYSFGPVRDKSGAILGSVVVARDITERKKAEKFLRDSLEEKVSLLKEVHHRVKNNLQIVASLLSLQAGRSDSPQVLDVLQDTRGRVRSMALLHETLYRSGNLARINFTSYLKDLCGQQLLSSGPAATRVTLEYHIAPVEMPLEQALPCGLIVNELVSNALKHGFPGDHAGKVFIGLETVENQTLVLSVHDQGVGLPPDFDLSSITTLGMQLVAGLVAQLGGQFRVETPPGEGAWFRAIIPFPKNMELGGDA